MKTSTSFAPSKKGQLSLASQSMGPKNFLRKEFLTTDGKKKNFPMFQGAFEFITSKIIHNGAQNPVMLSNFSLSIQLRRCAKMNTARDFHCLVHFIFTFS